MTTGFQGGTESCVKRLPGAGRLGIAQPPTANVMACDVMGGLAVSAGGCRRLLVPKFKRKDTMLAAETSTDELPKRNTAYPYPEMRRAAARVRIGDHEDWKAFDTTGGDVASVSLSLICMAG